MTTEKARDVVDMHLSDFTFEATEEARDVVDMLFSDFTFEAYTNKRGENFTILVHESGSLQINDNNHKCIFKSNRGFSSEQAKKWCEL